MEVVLAILISIVAPLLLFKFLNHQTKPNLPPGPKPWPLIGNLNLMGPLPHQSLHTLSQTYGKLMHLKFGSSPVVVASSPHMAKLFLRTHDQVFASRPPTAVGKHITYNYHNVTWAPYGPYWNQGRKIFLQELFTSKRLDSFEYIRVQERQNFLSRLHTLSGKPTILRAQLSHTNLSIISRIVLGRKYFSESEDEKEMVTLEEFQALLDELFLLSGVLNIGDWIPWLDFLDLQGYVKRMKGLAKRFDRFYEHVIEEHRVKVGTDMVDLLLKLADDPHLRVNFNYDSVKAFALDLISGATDTSSTTTEWAMSELINQPLLIKKATEELDRVIGKERWVEETDFPNLPFIDSILKETMRLHPVTVLLPPHFALKDCKVDGYDIAKGTTIFINTWSIGRDPDLWDDPESFRPERFMGRDIDVKGQNFELLPFGSGRRMCPGYSLGLKMMKSSLCNMLQGFNWKLGESIRGEKVSMEEVYGLTTQRKFPLVVKMEPRLPTHLYKTM